MTRDTKYEINITKTAGKIAEAACAISFDSILEKRPLTFDELKDFAKSAKRVERMCLAYGFEAKYAIKYGNYDETFNGVRVQLKLHTSKGENGEIIVSACTDKDIVEPVNENEPVYCDTDTESFGRILRGVKENEIV